MTALSNEDYLLQKKVELMVEMSSKKMRAELEAMKAAIEKLNAELNELRKGVSTAKPEPQRKIAEAPKEAAKPRYGDYKPGDIDIDKFFYFGGGKK